MTSKGSASTYLHCTDSGTPSTISCWGKDFVRCPKYLKTKIQPNASILVGIFRFLLHFAQNLKRNSIEMIELLDPGEIQDLLKTMLTMTLDRRPVDTSRPLLINSSFWHMSSLSCRDTGEDFLSKHSQISASFTNDPRDMRSTKMSRSFKKVNQNEQIL